MSKESKVLDMVKRRAKQLRDETKRAQQAEKKAKKKSEVELSRMIKKIARCRDDLQKLLEKFLETGRRSGEFEADDMWLIGYDIEKAESMKKTIDFYLSLYHIPDEEIGERLDKKAYDERRAILSPYVDNAGECHFKYLESIKKLRQALEHFVERDEDEIKKADEIRKSLLSLGEEIIIPFVKKYHIPGEGD